MNEPMKKIVEIEDAYYLHALQLVGEYGELLIQKRFLEEEHADIQLYTKNMVIYELSGSSYSESERVQSSTISDPTARIGVKLADGYLDEMNRKIIEEIMEQAESYDAICKKLEVINTAMKERMDSRTRAVFSQVKGSYVTWSMVKDECGYKLNNNQISRALKKAVNAIALELNERAEVEENMGRKKKIVVEVEKESIDYVKKLIKDYPDMKKLCTNTEQERPQLLQLYKLDPTVFDSSRLPNEGQLTEPQKGGHGYDFVLDYWQKKERVYLLEYSIKQLGGNAYRVAEMRFLKQMNWADIMADLAISRMTLDRARNEAIRNIAATIDDYMYWKVECLFGL